MWLACAVAAVIAAQVDEMPRTAPGTLEGRPPPSALSPLQARIDAAAPGERVEVAPGEYVGDLYLDRPGLQLVGRGRPKLTGSGIGSVVLIRADGVRVEGFDIDGREGGDLGRDAAGVHVAARDAVVRDNQIVRTLFGVYLREANGARVEGNVIVGIQDKQAGEKGSGIHVWNTDGFLLEDNEIREVRDGFYIEQSPHGRVRRNHAHHLRYGLHYMFSDDNTFEENVFAHNAAGTVLMYSRRLAFRRNQIIHNRGYASVGLLYKACDDAIAEDNLIADNARGVFMEHSYRNRFVRNVIAESDEAIVLFSSAEKNVFEDNAFVANLSPLTLIGRRSDTVFRNNYWSGNDEPDLDGDGRSDRPYVLGSVFDHLRENLTAADLLALTPAAGAVAQAERAFPVLRQITVMDVSPRVRPPALVDVPRPARAQAPRSTLAGVVLSLAGMVAGLVVLASGSRRR